ncbi:hypothetical protein [Kaistia terrae]|uniref:Uncharacterized protein n=1 Tax=Kaistia terrae TaxID=537017 RepID=A0ABW0Q308_9HYPH|nr:hypothetical protein [Kaistia terrae]MCX5581452.1 hypothetical protein [Kaistia terrae]
MSSIDTKTIDRIKALRREAANFEGFHALYATKYAPDSNCDKKGFGFGRDDRYSAFKIGVSFDSWSGYYGNSSCGRIMNVQHQDVVAPYLTKALNEHQKTIFATVGRLMREDAARLTGDAAAEVAAIQQLLADAQADLAIEEAA